MRFHNGSHRDPGPLARPNTLCGHRAAQLCGEDMNGGDPKPVPDDHQGPPVHRFAPSSLIVGLVAAMSLAFTVTPAPTGDEATADDDIAYLAEDQAGDANGINGQGLPAVGDSVPSTSTDPAQVAEADLLSARVTSTWWTQRGADGLRDHIFTGVQFRTGLAAQPGPDSAPVLHRFIGSIGDCEIWIQFAAGGPGGAGHGTASARLGGTVCGTSDDPTTISHDEISWAWDPVTSEAVVTIDARFVPLLGDLLVDGATYQLTELDVQVHAVTGDTAVVIDHMPGEGASTTLGTDVPPDEEPPPLDGGHTGGPGNDVPPDTTALCGRYADGTTGSTPTQGEDRTGAGADTLTLGMHAPATGAAPLPTTSFQEASDLYWRAVAEDCGETVLGRSTVEVEIRDDQYDPSKAGQVCKELATRSFLLLGGGGTDQVQRCGQLAAIDAFPYFSVGVTEAGLRDNAWYFGSTMSFREQGGLLAEYVAANPDELEPLGPDARIGTIVTDTINYDDALQGWQEGLATNELESLLTVRPTKNDDTWMRSVARDFQQEGIEVVYFLNAPTILLDFAREADETYGYNPLYIGVASDTSLNAVLRGGCNEPGRRLDGGVWLSGTPGLDAAPTAFFEAADAFEVPADDIALRMWSFAEQQRQLLEAYEEVFGHDITREDFRAFVEDSDVTTERTFPAASWSPSDHFPSEAMHVVQANCELEEHVTLHVDAQGF